MKKALLSVSIFLAATVLVSAQNKSTVPKEKAKAGFGVTVVQEQAEYPGGSDSLQVFLQRNLVYPNKAKIEKVSGRVYVSFKVSEEGKIVDAKVISGVNPDLDNEAVRVANQMPDWKPGTIGGKPVKVQYILPIDFVLPKGE